MYGGVAVRAVLLCWLVAWAARIIIIITDIAAKIIVKLAATVVFVHDVAVWADVALERVIPVTLAMVIVNDKTLFADVALEGLVPVAVTVMLFELLMRIVLCT